MTLGGDGRALGGPRGRPGLAAFLLGAALAAVSVAGAAVTPAPAGAQDRTTFDVAEAEGSISGIGVRLAEMPANRQGDPRANRYIVDHVAPGAVIERRMEVSNGTREPVELNLYAAAAHLADGAFVPDPGRGQNDLAAWTTLTPSTLRLQPGDAETVSLRIAVPRDAPPGERYAAAVAELPPRERGAAMDMVMRAGIRMYLSVGPGAEPRIDFQIPTLTANRDGDGHPSVVALVRNTGDRAIDVVGDLALTDGPAKLAAGPFPVASIVSIAPGEEAPVAAVLDQAIPDGPWTARMTLRSGALERQAAAVVTFPAPGADGTVVTATPIHNKAPLRLILLAALLVLLTAAVLALVSRHVRTGPGETPSVRPA